ncbi:hypothetical protein RISK_003130 [Rhodopirellula islandica]|uniref:DUF4340 domain-containing protein n=1 Tax=Rhodopirellula islandica TaxID=595434 RepID=A0A0J1BE37_RHOIS|nr:DUF4340 domain-containing protein [Rhodopirellula islandica]KLU04862.1 hypothetical protein RISK_003130 [Rhodopirellula islandica]
MNEGKKTGAFWAAAAVMLAVGLFVAWPTSTQTESPYSPGKPLFEKFKDPLTASNLKIVTFDEEQGQLGTFEVRRDAESGVWTIPSRKGYPADAVEQMRDAANALVGLNILDVQTENQGDHAALGVVEPKLEDLQVGDTGVGRLVTFKDESQQTLASLIIGNPVKNEEGKIYVRKPGQDPVYVVKMDDSVLSTKFQDWIEDDLLQMSSIDIKEAVVKVYSASISGRSVALERNYTAKFAMDGAEWALKELLEYNSDNPLAEPKLVEQPADKELNTTKLNEMKNALDDLKIVDVVRKPEGMSANLRADKDLISDNEAVQSLYTRGFFPVGSGAEGEFEVLSANGELNVTVDEGVEYVLRFGDVQGLSDDTEGEEEGDAGGVNRYLLVTARVNEDQFPAPDLQPVPQTIEELAAMLGVGEEEAEEAAEEPAAAEVEMKEEPAEAPAEEAAEEAAVGEDQPEAAEEEMKEVETESAETEETSAEPTEEAEPAADEADATEEVEVSGEGEASGEGQGAIAQDEDDSTDEPSAESDSQTEQAASAEEATEEAGADEEMALQPAGDDAAEAPVVEAPEEEQSDELTFAELTDEEKQERLEAEQEKILKANTRLLDERKDRLNAAKRRVADLNARFADWYYIIPEATYRQLRINRDELFVEPGANEAAPAGPPGGLPPGMQLPAGFGN